MNRALKSAAVLLLVVMASYSWSQAADASFAPFEQWKAAVLAGDETALSALYSTDPPAEVSVKLVKGRADTDISFWLGLKARSMKTEVVRNEMRHGHISYIFRAEVR